MDNDGVRMIVMPMPTLRRFKVGVAILIVTVAVSLLTLSGIHAATQIHVIIQPPQSIEVTTTIRS